ncbi:hypothetical protein EVAR_55726_1 [Eumeta japonica]|uniref:Uncharacterized protein n=1 Tax=Eumeta variegata TaxID=151549 RepID=A0A4C1Z119_EUMVA|nr:hypothetical protein EVAR_55726_1 [Eumeta japonica]
MREGTLKRSIVWKYIPLGAWERLVRSIKTALYDVLNDQHPHEETLHTGSHKGSTSRVGDLVFIVDSAATKHLTGSDHRSRLSRARQNNTYSRSMIKRWDTSEADKETHHPAYTAHRQERRFTTIDMQRRRRCCTVGGRVAQKWFKRFQFDNFDVKYEPRSGRPVTDEVDAILGKVEKDRYISSYNIGEDLGTCKPLDIKLKNGLPTKRTSKKDHGQKAS